MEDPTEAPPLDLVKRRQGVSASEIAGILGLSQYEDPFTIYNRKVGALERPDGISPADIRRRMGRAQENEILRLYTEATGRLIIRPGTLTHPERKWQLATPDALVIDEARGVECKTAGWRQSHEWGDPEIPEEADRVPVEYFLQCQYGMSVTRSPVWDLPAWIGGDFFAIYTLRFDERIETAMLDAAREFLEKYLWPHVPPPAGWTPEASQWIKERFPAHEKGLVLAATSEDENLAARLFALSEFSDALERKTEETKNRLKMRMETAETLKGAGGWEIRWKKCKDSEKTDWEAAAKEMLTALQLIASTAPSSEMPAIAKGALSTIERYTKTVPGARRFGPHRLTWSQLARSPNRESEHVLALLRGKEEQ